MNIIKQIILKLVGHKRELKKCYQSRVPEGGSVVDVGCFGFTQYKYCTNELRLNFVHSGVDYNNLANIPTDFDFRQADLNQEKIPFDSRSFDLVVCSHVIEHIVDPIVFFQECMRICKPGGYIYIEAPSERSIYQKGITKKFSRMLSTNFYDDPTHLGRPWSMQAMYRLACYHEANPISVGLYQSTLIRVVAPFLKPIVHFLGFMTAYEFLVWYQCGWASFLVAQRPADAADRAPFSYFIDSGEQE